MLCAYYDRSCDSSELFEDLAISQDPTFETYRNQYDVIYLDMTGVMQAAQEKELNLTSFIVQALAEELHTVYPQIILNLDLTDMLVKAVETNKTKFVMIIDEWDAPIRETPAQQDRYLKLLRALFKNSGTTDKIFAAAYMTGILPIKKDGSQSAISEFKEYTMLRPQKFDSYIGFTEEEVRTLCQEYKMSFQRMKFWYDGYHFKNVSSIYNPNSVMEAIRNEEFDSYWVQTSAAESLLTYIDMDEDGMQEDVARLISGEMVEVNTKGFANDFQTFYDKNDVLTLMIHLGYLSYTRDEQGTGWVQIPNEEIRSEYNNMLRRSRHHELIRLVRESDELLQKTIADEAAIARVYDFNTRRSITMTSRYCARAFDRYHIYYADHVC